MLIIVYAAFKSGGECAAVASEENEDIIILDGYQKTENTL